MKTETAIQEAVTKTRSTWRIELGKLGETRACEHLRQCGWKILDCNWRSGKYGEIDLVARTPENLLVFCEVKTRFLTGIRPGNNSGDNLGKDWQTEPGFHNEGFEAVHWKKQRKIVVCAMNYMRYYRVREQACRFDVISIEYRLPPDTVVDRSTDPLDTVRTLIPIVRHVEGAFC